MKNNLKKVFAVAFAISVMSCFTLSTSAIDEPDGEWWGDAPWYDSSVDDNNEDLENSVATVMNYSEITDNVSPFVESALIILCVVGGFTLGTRFLKKSFR